MRPIVKRIVILGSLLAAAGVLLVGTALALSGFDWSEAGISEQFVEKTYTADRAYTSLELDTWDTPVEIHVGGERISLSYSESNLRHYEFRTSGDTLEIQCISDRKWYDYIGFQLEGFAESSLVLTIPAEMAGDVEIFTSNGAITLDAALSVDGALTLESSNAAVLCQDVTAGSLEVISSNGELLCQNASAEEIYLETSNGSLTAENLSAGTITAATSNGRLALSGLQADTIETENSNGGLSLAGITAGTLTGETSNADIVLERVEVTEALTLESSNAAISGTVVGDDVDFTIESETSNASSNLPERWGSGDIRLTARTSNGDIQIDFVR